MIRTLGSGQAAVDTGYRCRVRADKLSKHLLGERRKRKKESNKKNKDTDIEIARYRSRATDSLSAKAQSR